MDTIKPESNSMREAFISLFNSTMADFDVPELSEEDVYVVWFCYIVGNAKCLISTTRPDHMYYELTYHVDKHQLHVDAYTKIKHQSIDL